VARTPDEALALAGDAPEVIVFGGAGVFKDFLPRADRIYLTEVDTEAAGDTYFPPLDPSDWREVDRTRHAADAKHPFAFEFVTLERIR
jgi:dihydrofolate reductase